MRRRLVLLAAAVPVAAMAAGCAQNVEMLDIHDQRLPIESRRWIADSEDSVAVAAAWLDTLRREEAGIERESERLLERAEEIESAGSGDAAGQLRELVAARRKFAATRRARAEAELELAKVKRVHFNAETAMRHDLGVYERLPLYEKVVEKRERVHELAGAEEEQRIALEEVTSNWWRAYSAWISGGGKREIFWQSKPSAEFVPLGKKSEGEAAGEEKSETD